MQPTVNKLGIIGAMDVEVEALHAQMHITQDLTRSHMHFVEGTLQGQPCVVVRCGIGKINAAACVQILVDLFNVDAVVNTGVAGSLDNNINIGDIVLSTDVIHHDMDVTGLGYAAGEVPGLGTTAFPASAQLRALAQTAAQNVTPELGIFEGRVASGDQFIADKTKKIAIATQFGASCCEMEGASIGQTSWLNNVPFLVVRAISDKADGSAEVPYAQFEKSSAEKSARLVAELARLLSQSTCENTEV